MTLNGWIRENRRAIARRNRLNDDVVRWQGSKSTDFVRAVALSPDGEMRLSGSWDNTLRRWPAQIIWAK
jgi:WD40 repeat protein